MTNKNANAYPKKRFFLEMFTRDISLEDCILDLIDNSIDALIRSRHIDILSDLLNPVSSDESVSSNKQWQTLPTITVSFSDKEFRITDKCGGISPEAAQAEVFNFGHSNDFSGSLGQLGAYGIGLKRAIFKIGNHFDMESTTTTGGFKVSIDVKEWSKKDTKISDWTIPLELTKGVKTLTRAGTSIKIRDLRPEVCMRINDGSVEGILHTKIAQTYALFLERYVRIYLNNQVVQPETMVLGQSEEIQVGKDQFDEKSPEGVVTVILIAGLAARTPKNTWPLSSAGWYVLCNGRVVVAADKTDLTGWGAGLANFHYKYRGFKGFAFFFSENPLLLPWTTTKRGLNRESPVYQRARNRMVGLSKPVVTFLNDMYPSEVSEEIAEKAVATNINRVAANPSKGFGVVRKKSAPKTTVQIAFQSEKDDVARIKKCVREPSWSAAKVGEYTFEHYLRMECPE